MMNSGWVETSDTAVKSDCGSYDSLDVATLRTCVGQLPNTKVYPSGAARATRSVPILPDPPPTFSMITGWPRGPRIPSAKIRAIASVDPKRGVVGPDLQSHAVCGLYVTDASVFPTNMGVNPQHSIMAMSWRASEWLANAGRSAAKIA